MTISSTHYLQEQLLSFRMSDTNPVIFQISCLTPSRPILLDSSGLWAERWVQRGASTGLSEGTLGGKWGLVLGEEKSGSWREFKGITWKFWLCPCPPIPRMFFPIKHLISKVTEICLCSERGGSQVTRLSLPGHQGRMRSYCRLGVLGLLQYSSRALIILGPTGWGVSL